MKQKKKVPQNHKSGSNPLHCSDTYKTKTNVGINGSLESSEFLTFSARHSKHGRGPRLCPFKSQERKSCCRKELNHLNKWSLLHECSANSTPVGFTINEKDVHSSSSWRKKMDPDKASAICGNQWVSFAGKQVLNLLNYKLKNQSANNVWTLKAKLCYWARCAELDVSPGDVERLRLSCSSDHRKCVQTVGKRSSQAGVCVHVYVFSVKCAISMASFGKSC